MVLSVNIQIINHMMRMAIAELKFFLKVNYLTCDQVLDS